MSDLEVHPEAALCEASPGPGPRTDSYPAREVPLGGVRGVFVQRSLPQRDLPTVGAWCFLDHFGSTAPREDLPPDIDPHPHIGLQTVTWPFEGQIRHRDSVGSDGNPMISPDSPISPGTPPLSASPPRPCPTCA